MLYAITEFDCTFIMFHPLRITKYYTKSYGEENTRCGISRHENHGLKLFTVWSLLTGITNVKAA